MHRLLTLAMISVALACAPALAHDDKAKPRPEAGKDGRSDKEKDHGHKKDIQKEKGHGHDKKQDDHKEKGHGHDKKH